MVTFTFDRQGAISIAGITAASIGQCCAVVLDNEVMIAPVIQTTISGRAGAKHPGFHARRRQKQSERGCLVV